MQLESECSPVMGIMVCSKILADESVEIGLLRSGLREFYFLGMGVIQALFQTVGKWGQNGWVGYSPGEPRD